MHMVLTGTVPRLIGWSMKLRVPSEAPEKTGQGPPWRNLTVFFPELRAGVTNYPGETFNHLHKQRVICTPSDELMRFCRGSVCPKKQGREQKSISCHRTTELPSVSGLKRCRHLAAHLSISGNRGTLLRNQWRNRGGLVSRFCCSCT